MAAILPVDAATPGLRAQPGKQPPKRQNVLPWADGAFALLAHGAAWLTLLLLVGLAWVAFAVPRRSGSGT